MKEPLDFPLVEKDRSLFPDDAKCPWCGSANVQEPNSFASISGGASVVSMDPGNPRPAVRNRAYLSFVWHGAHDEGTGSDPGIYTSVDLAEQVEKGMFEIHFCSPACLRSFLNACVDRLEKQISNERE